MKLPSRNALTTFLRPSLTTSQLGMGWKQATGYYELDGLHSLLTAVRGKYLIVSDDPALMSGMLANVNRKSDLKPAVFVAEFDHKRERDNFARLVTVVDRPDTNPSGYSGQRTTTPIPLGEHRQPQQHSGRRFVGKNCGARCWRQDTANGHLPMGAVKRIELLLVIGMLAAPTVTPPDGEAFAENTRDSLFAQSAAQLLQREFTAREVSYLLLDVQTGAVLASRWEDSDQPIPLGSLVKPFVALAYGEAHQFRYPAHQCRGDASGCWLPHGHGEIGITAAIADSCNSYFRMLTAAMTSADVIPSAQRIGSGPARSRFIWPGPDRCRKSLAGFASAHGACVSGTQSAPRPVRRTRNNIGNGTVRTPGHRSGG